MGMSHHTKLNFPFFSFSFCSVGENQNQGRHRFHGVKLSNLRCGWHQQVSVWGRLGKEQLQHRGRGVWVFAWAVLALPLGAFLRSSDSPSFRSLVL